MVYEQEKSEAIRSFGLLELGSVTLLIRNLNKSFRPEKNYS